MRHHELILAIRFDAILDARGSARLRSHPCLEFCDDEYGIGCWSGAPIDVCNDFRWRCEQNCEPRAQPQNPLRFRTTVGGAPATLLKFRGIAACTSNPFAEDRKKGLRLSFTPPPNVTGPFQAPWGLPFGNSFELECGENQDVLIQFSPTEPGIYAQTLFKWEVRNGAVIETQAFTLVGEALPAQ